MLARERFAVDVVGEKICGIVESEDGMPGCVTFCSVEDCIFRGGENSGALDDWLQQRAGPFGVADEAAADGIRDAFKGEDGFVRRKRANFVVGEAQVLFYEATGCQGPFARISGGSRMG